jgi:integrase
MATVIIQGRKVKVPYLVRQSNGAYYWQPRPHMRAAGFRPEALGRDPIKAAARAQVLNEEWMAIKNAGGTDAPLPSGTFGWLCGQYERSGWYKDLAHRTRETYDMGLRVLTGSPLAKRQVAAISRGDVRRLMDRVHETRSDEYQRKIAKVLRRVLAYGVELELIKVNPASNLGIKSNKPRRQRWQPGHVNAFVAAAIEAGYPGWALAVMLAYDTTQRLGDVLKIQHGHFDGEGVKVTQGKTEKEVWCPLAPETIALYRRIERRAVTMVYGTSGRPITNRTYFNRVFRKIAEAVDLPPDLQFRDLRRTGISEVLAGGGRGEPISGHAQGSLAIRIYEVADKEAARSSMAARRRGREQ